MGDVLKIGTEGFPADTPLFILGPCVIESEEMTLRIAEELLDLKQKLNLALIFKASFDKANRSSIHSFRGPGLEEGLRILQKVKDETGLPLISDVHETGQVRSAAQVLDVLQIPAFLCRQTDLLMAAAQTDCWLNVKKGQFLAPQDMSHVVYKIDEVRGPEKRRLLLTERGSTFGYRDLVVDVRSIPLMADTGCPVIIDATHAVQQPGAAGQVTGGQPRFIPTIAQAGIVSGARGVFMEVHPDPSVAKSDGFNALSLSFLPPLLTKLIDLYHWRIEHE